MDVYRGRLFPLSMSVEMKQDSRYEGTTGAIPRSLGLVVPIRDEEECLPIFLSAVDEQLKKLECSTEIVVVDDGSRDGSWAWLERQQHNRPALTLVRLTRGFGKEAAIKAGLSVSTANAVIVMDADLQHPVGLIPEMYRIWRETRAWVVGAVKRGLVPRTPLKHVGASLFYSLGERLTGLELRNRSDFQLLDRRAVDLFLSLPERITTFRGIIAWLGLPTATVLFDVAPRAAGKTGWSFKKLAELALDMLTGFTNAPLRLMTYASFLFGMFAMLLGIQTLYVYLSGQAVEGFTTVILVVLVTGTALCIGLGIIGEYLARIYEEVKARPQYVVEELRRRPPK
jgi:polyisoprenyl-phosphate glycosyltransferase